MPKQQVQHTHEHSHSWPHPHAFGFHTTVSHEHGHRHTGVVVGGYRDGAHHRMHFHTGEQERDLRRQAAR